MKKKECPNPVVISSNIGVGNLFKEMLPSTPYINLPFAFPAAKEKRKCVRTDAAYIPTDGKKRKKKRKNYFCHVHTDGNIYI
jgi:hypothetical protein